MKTRMLYIGFFLLAVFLLSGCYPKMYETPKRGAEYEVDRGFPPEKHPRPLFNKKMRKKMSKKGQLHDK